MSEPVAIEVRNLPRHMTREALEHVFRKELQDDNEIKYILFPVPETFGKALICFKHGPDKKFIERILAQNPQWNVTLDSRMQTYNCCSAEVDALVVASIPDIPECIRMLQKDYGVIADFSDESGKLVLKGTLNQLQCARERLDDIFKQQMALQKMELMQLDTSNDRIRLGSRPFSSIESTADRTLTGPETRRDSEKLSDPLSRRVLDSYDQSDTSRKNLNDRPYQSLVARTSFENSEATFSNSRFQHDPISYADAARGSRRLESERNTGESHDFTSLPCIPDRNREGDGFYSTEFLHKRQPLVSELLHSSTKHHDISQGKDYQHSDNHSESSIDVGRRNVGRSISMEQFEAGGLSDMPPTSSAYSLGNRIPSSDSARHAESGQDAEYHSLITSETEISREVDRRIRSAFHDDKFYVTSERYPGSSDLQTSTKYYSLPVTGFDRTNGDGVRHKSPSDFERPQRIQSARETNVDELNVQGSFQKKDVPSEDEVCLYMEAYITRYLMTIEKESVNTIKRRYGVEIKWSAEPGADIITVVFHGLLRDQVQKASEKFAKLYEDIFSDIIQREVWVDSDLPDVLDVVKYIERYHGDHAILITDVPGVVTVVGEFRDVMKAVDMLNNVKSEIGNRVHRSRGRVAPVGFDDEQTTVKKPTSGEEVKELQEKKTSLVSTMDILDSSKNPQKTSESSTDQKSFPERGFPFSQIRLADETGQVRRSVSDVVDVRHSFQIKFEDSLWVSIYSEDLTKVKTDAIVNAANSFLKNYGGVARAIEEAGGPQFKEDCDDLCRSRGPLKVSEVVHTDACGELECRWVIHTVGPQWYSITDADKCASELQATFSNVFVYADQVLKVRSLALPAVGTGVFGVPLDVCARAIYFALRHFLREQTSSSTLESVHIVNKDPGTTEMIQAVFEGLRMIEEEQRSSDNRHFVSDDSTGELRMNKVEASSEKLSEKFTAGKDDVLDPDEGQSLKDYTKNDDAELKRPEREAPLKGAPVENLKLTNTDSSDDCPSERRFRPVADRND